MSIESLGSMGATILVIAVTLEDSNRNKVVRLLLALIGKRSRLTAAIFTIFFLLIHSQIILILMLVQPVDIGSATSAASDFTYNMGPQVQ